MALYAAVADCIEAMARSRGIPSILYCVDARLPEAASAATLRGAVREFSELALARKLDAAQDGEYGRAAIAAFPGLELCRVGFSDLEGVVAASVAIFEDEAASARNLILASLRSSSKTESVSPTEGDPSGTGDVSKDYGETRYPFTATLGGLYIGMGTLSYPRGDESQIRESVMINGLGILPEWRGQGLGRALLRGLIGIAASPRTLGVPQAGEIRLEVDTGNPSALNLYLSEGFCETARTDYFRLRL
jgi:GNAT superfamily N-acetyltransferase